MPNLVGIGNKQVPTNAMLGGLAYQDSVGEINIEKLKARTSDNPVTIFVYDTRKDSDGGAWRHRTQNTSWYNEGASMDRGARKEFPAVAVITAEGGKLIIHDGDDPNLPMWMIFRQATNRIIFSNITSVHMLNGLMVVGTDPNASNQDYWDGGIKLFNFISEDIRSYSRSRSLTYYMNISQRNIVGTKNVQRTGVRQTLASPDVADVAMTVLPNALIDIKTELPVPTIAAATDEGVTVILDSGIAFDSVATTAGYIESRKVEFSKSGEYLYIIQDPSLVYSYKTSSFSGDRSSGTLTGYAGLSFFSAYVSSSGPASTTKLVRGNDLTINIGHANTGLALLYPDSSYTSNSLDNASSKMICRITKDFNTGWMHGDILGAFMSDVATEKDNVNYALSAQYDGTNRLTSQTYSNGALSWQMVDNAGSNNGYVVTAFKGLTVGQSYKISMTWDNNATLDSGYMHRVVHQNGTSVENNTNFDHWNKTNGSSETLTGVFVAQTADNDDLVIYANAITLNVSNFKIEETDDVNATGDGNGTTSSGNLIQNPGPSFSNTSGWGATNGSLSVSSGDLLLTGANNVNEHMYSAGFTLISGKTYVLFVDSNQIFSYCRIGTNIGLSSSEQLNESVGQGLNSFTFTASATGTFYLKLGMVTSYVTGSINSVSLSIAEKDRSVKGNGLQIHGQITKEPVNNGSELVSYSGFSATNFLDQPYNSDLNFDNNDFAVYGWFKLATNNSQQCIMMLMEPTGQVDYVLVEQQANGELRFQVDSLNGASVAYATTLPTGVWIHYCGINLDDDRTYLYINGKNTELHNNTVHGFGGSSFDNTTGRLTFGRRAESEYDAANSKPFGGELALWRISKSVPSPEQIKKMYNEEKKLFIPDSKCTLYGTSDAVTGLAFDDTNGVVHIGTSSGRSEFNGLNRINNTTTAVTAAISASNGLVAER